MEKSKSNKSNVSNKNNKNNKNKKKNPIGRYVLHYWYLYAIGLVTMFTCIFLDMCSPIVIQHIIDDVIVAGKMNLLMKCLAALVIIGLCKCVLSYIKEFTFDCAAIRIANKMRKNIYTHIKGLSVSFFDKNNTGELMARVKDDIDRVWDAIGFIIMLVIEGSVNVISIIYCMIHISPWLTIVPLCITPVVGFIAIKMERELDKVYGDISEENAELNTVVQENLSGVRTVKAFAREDFEIKKFRKHNKRYCELNEKQARVLAKYDPYISFLTKIMLISVILMGGFMVIKGNLTIGKLGAFVEYANNIMWPMEIIGWLGNSLASAVASNKKINVILAQEPEVKEHVLVDEKQIVEEEMQAIENESQTVDKDNVNKLLTFSHVSLTREGKEIVKDINFELERGKTLGIMGMTGSGKSSIANLIERFYDVTEGKITMEGKNIANMSFKALRSQVALVSQDVFLFSDTIKNNVRLGVQETMKEELVKDALAQSCAKDFIEKMPDQYDTVIGERGVGLSGGQKQRISMARALAREASILILDDSTSALDMETEYAIEQEWKKMNNTAKIIIAHRISAVCDADEIIVMDKGSIMERGTHESLMAQKGYYYNTYQAQYGA